MIHNRDILLELSNLDSKIHKYEKQIQALPKKLQSLQKQFNDIKEKVLVFEKKDKKTFQQISEIDTLILIEKNRMELSIQNMKESRDQENYFFYKKERDLCERITNDLEKQKANLAKITYQDTPEFKELKEEYTVCLDLLKEEQVLLEKEQAEIQKLIQDIVKKIESYLPKIDPIILKKYEYLSKRKITPSVIEITDQNCTGCFMNFTAQQFQEVIRDGIGSCPYCQRLALYKEEETISI